MTTTPPKRRAPARKPRAAMAPSEAIADIVGDVSLDLFPITPAVSADVSVDASSHAWAAGRVAAAATEAAAKAPAAARATAPAPVKRRTKAAAAAASAADAASADALAADAAQATADAGEAEEGGAESVPVAAPKGRAKAKGTVGAEPAAKAAKAAKTAKPAKAVKAAPTTAETTVAEDASEDAAESLPSTAATPAKTAASKAKRSTRRPTQQPVVEANADADADADALSQVGSTAIASVDAQHADAGARSAADARADAEIHAGVARHDDADALLPVSLMPASIDDAVEDIFQALMSDEDDEVAADAALNVAVEAPRPARKRGRDAGAATTAVPAADADVASDAEGTGRTSSRRRGAKLPVGDEGASGEGAADGTPMDAAGRPVDGDRAGTRRRPPAGKRGSASQDLSEAQDPRADIETARASYASQRSEYDAELDDADASYASEADAVGEYLSGDPVGSDLIAPSDEAIAPVEIQDTRPSRHRRKPYRAPDEAVSAVSADGAEPPQPPRFTLGPREDEAVFGDYELRDAETAGTFRLRLLGHGLWRCDCAGYLAQGDCDHGEHLMDLLNDDQYDAVYAGWSAREAEVWLVPGAERRLQWIAGRDVPAALRDQPGLDERQRRDAELSQAWLQSVVAQARAAGVPLRVDAPVWPQLAWGRDAQARVDRLEKVLADGAAMEALLSDALAPHQWEAALFAVCAGRALIADDLGLGQRGSAIAAIRLWDQLFGATPALVIAPAAAHAAWQRDLSRWLGQGASSVTVAEAPTAKHAPALLVVDGIESLDDAALEALRALEARTGAHLLLIAHQEPLAQPALARWVDWLDNARRGPYARLTALPPDAGKKALREALEPVVLSRRKRELLERLPACLQTPMWLDAAGSSLPQGPLKQLRQTVERWTARPFLSSAEQQQLMEALALLPPSSRQALAAKAEAVLAVRRDWVESPTPAAGRLLVCSRSETLLDSLAQSPQLRRLPPHRLRAGDSAEARAATLKAWREAPAGVLLASDDALAAVPPGLLAQDRVAVIHADLPWQATTLEDRVMQACGDDCCGIPAALLLISGSLDAGLRQAHAKGLAFPHWLDAPPAWLESSDIEALMAVLPALLEGV